MAKKEGCNFEDVNRVKEWAAQGKSAEQISDLIGVKVENVRKNMPDYEAPEDE